VRVAERGEPWNGAHVKEVRAERAIWTPDGKALILLGADDIRYHDLETGQERVIAQHRQPSGISLSSDGRTLCSAEVEGHVRRQVIENFGERPRPR
jgi:hypothetical protein